MSNCSPFNTSAKWEIFDRGGLARDLVNHMTLHGYNGFVYQSEILAERSLVPW
jgi:hypothetical protein